MCRNMSKYYVEVSGIMYLQKWSQGGNMKNIKLYLGEFMRLYNYCFLCKKLKKKVTDITVSTVTQNGNYIYCIENWREYKIILAELRKVIGLEKAVDDVYRTVPVFVSGSDRPQIDKATKNKLFENIYILIHKMDAIIDLGMSLEQNNKAFGIDISIPKCSDIKQYIGYLKDIDFIFNQCPYMIEKDATIQFTGTDIGSWWIVLGVMGGVAACTAVMKNLAELIDCATRIKSHFVSVKQQEQILEQMKCETDAKKSYCDVLATMNREILRKEIESLHEQSKIDDPEKTDRVVRSLEKIINLLNNGGGIYTSIEAPKDVQVLFPPVDYGNVLSEEIMKLLEDKKEATEQ